MNDLIIIPGYHGGRLELDPISESDLKITAVINAYTKVEFYHNRLLGTTATFFTYQAGGGFTASGLTLHADIDNQLSINFLRGHLFEFEVDFMHKHFTIQYDDSYTSPKFTYEYLYEFLYKYVLESILVNKEA